MQRSVFCLVKLCGFPSIYCTTHSKTHSDDGPSPFTPLVLKALADRGLKATFFVIGSNILTNPQILYDAFTAGHSIGIHTWSHKYLTTLTNDQIVAEVVW